MAKKCDQTKCFKDDPRFTKRPFWWGKREKTYTVEEISELLARVKEFNAGVIDALLDKHIDRVYKEWLAEKNG